MYQREAVSQSMCSRLLVYLLLNSRVHCVVESDKFTSTTSVCSWHCRLKCGNVVSTVAPHALLLYQAGKNEVGVRLLVQRQPQLHHASVSISPKRPAARPTYGDVCFERDSRANISNINDLRCDKVGQVRCGAARGLSVIRSLKVDESGARARAWQRARLQILHTRTRALVTD
ncbi:hypothetical protein J6590_027147 [Homalodisca vitripennis]|nr:hypothetical protein J6590_027147 [Homalodisca vitripennis]